MPPAGPVWPTVQGPAVVQVVGPAVEVGAGVVGAVVFTGAAVVAGALVLGAVVGFEVVGAARGGMVVGAGRRGVVVAGRAAFLLGATLAALLPASPDPDPPQAATASVKDSTNIERLAIAGAFRGRRTDTNGPSNWTW